MRIAFVRQGHRSLHATPLRFQVIRAKEELINNKTTGKNNARTITDFGRNPKQPKAIVVNGFVSIAKAKAGVVVLGNAFSLACFGF